MQIEHIDTGCTHMQFENGYHVSILDYQDGSMGFFITPHCNKDSVEVGVYDNMNKRFIRYYETDADTVTGYVNAAELGRMITRVATLPDAELHWPRKFIIAGSR